MFVLPASYDLPFGATRVLREMLGLGWAALAVVALSSAAAARLGLAGAGCSALALLVALCLLPTSLLGRMKEGSSSVSDLSLFFVYLAASLLLPELAFRVGRHPLVLAARAACALGLAAALLLGGAALARASRQRGELPAWWNARDAFAFARAHPGEVYFPDNPLVALLADGRLDHFQEALAYYVIAGHAPSQAQLRRHLPGRLRWVASPNARPGVLEHLPEFGVAFEIPELPGFTVHGRAEDAPLTAPGPAQP
jgi:hypothetical protein